MSFFGKRQEREEGHDSGSVSSPEIEAIRRSLLEARMTPAVEEVALREVGKLARTDPGATEYTIGVTYLEYLASLPWHDLTEDRLDAERAERILNENHFGLDDAKDRILEYLAVRTLRLNRRHAVLVVDDDPVARANLEHLLGKQGYQVTVAAGGREALEILGRSRFDAVVTDYRMEGADGLAVLDRAKELDPRTAVIMITGFATMPTAVEALTRGSYHFLAKPWKSDELRAIVGKALAERKLEFSSRGPILCFVGPPGTGKTSLQRSIAKCLERRFIGISLAGMKDVAELRGHRRSYVGALPGRIIQEIRRAGSRNPVIMLDEIDKIDKDFKGDPSSVLLEVLDPEQNKNFLDHYLDVPFDLSRAMFIATANTTDSIPEPLLDRMEIIRLAGYSQEEKEEIAFRHLIPRAVEEAGLFGRAPEFTDEAVRKIIREYTREAGLRNLQRQIAAICRKMAREIVRSNGAGQPLRIDSGQVEKFLGPKRHYFEVADAAERVGVATGLAWTATGGEIVFIEAAGMKGGKNLLLTGSLGEVMKESAQAALSHLRSNAARFGIAEDFYETMDIHVHVPAGAIPKDGPSAGLTIFFALLSLLTKRPCRRDTAVTGELTLSGRILPVGGLREKVLSARRAGVTTVVFPAANEAELRELPEHVRLNMRLVTTDDPAAILDTVLR